MINNIKSVLMHYNLFVLLGYSGATLILAGYVLGRARIVISYGRSHDILNLVGSGLLVTYAVTLRSVPFAVLNGIWMIAAIVGVVFGHGGDAGHKMH